MGPFSLLLNPVFSGGVFYLGQDMITSNSGRTIRIYKLIGNVFM